MMSKKQSGVTALLLPSADSDSADFNVIKKYLFHWPLFLVFVVIALGLASYYLKTASPVYPITATLKFNAPTITSQQPPSDELEKVSSPVIVQNELKVIQSKKLIYEVVKDLGLWINYSQKKGFTTHDLYNNTPVLLTFIDTNINFSPVGIKLDIFIKDANSFLLQGPDGMNTQVTYSTPVKSAFGTWKLSPTRNLENFTGSKITINVRDPDQVSGGYQGSVKVELENKDAPFVNLSMTDQVPNRGRDFLNSLIAVYGRNAELDKEKLTQKIFEFISTHADSVKRDLDDAEQKMEAFRNSQKITDLPAQTASNREVKEFNERALNDINVQLSILATFDAYTSSSSNRVSLPSVSESLPDRSLVSLYDKLAGLQLEREQKLAITPEANPLFISIDSQISVLKNNFKEKIQTIRTALLANKKQLEAFGAGIQTSLDKVPYQEREYTALKRDQESKEATYKFLSGKQEEIALHHASLAPDFQIVDDAHAGAMKWPRPMLVYLMATTIGFIAAAGLLYVRQILIEKITGRKQIEKETDVPILGVLSYQYTSNPIVVSEGRSKFAIGEQFRVLRTNLYHLHGNNEPGRVTLITSSVSGEGKSFVSANLAVTLAYAFRKTIILEMDLRQPKVSDVFGLSTDHLGISNYLSGDTFNLQAMIRPSGIPGLDVLSCGAILPNPSELLEKETLDELIATLKKLYDDIIIDSPPIHLVTDSLIIARTADAVLYVVRHGYTHKNELDFISEINASKRFNKFTIVFNGVKSDAAGYAGYGYSNYNSYTDKQKWNIASGVKEFLMRF